MREATYTILDEPQPGRLSRYVVDPFWPLLSMMMSGTWLAGPWFIFNAFAIGSATRKSETWLVIASVLTSIAFLWTLGLASRLGYWPDSARPYVQIAMTVIRLSFAYVIWMRQQRSLDLYTYYGGTVRNGAIVLIASVFARFSLVGAPKWFQVFFMS